MREDLPQFSVAKPERKLGEQVPRVDHEIFEGERADVVHCLILPKSGKFR